MREILFRGKSRYTGVWVEGYFSMEVGGIPYIQWLEYDGYYHEEAVEECAVILDTVGEYTGLTDKNGKKIFEGDILIYFVDGEYDVNEKYLVVFDDDEAAFRTKFYYEGEYMCYEDIIPCENFEIIGNIYDNPELLEGE